MAKTYHITIEYTTMGNSNPNKWNWYEILDMDTSDDTLDVSVHELRETNEYHVTRIITNRDEDN